MSSTTQFRIEMVIRDFMMNYPNRLASPMQAKRRNIPLFVSTLLMATFLTVVACAQDRPTAAYNEFELWVDGQFGNGHAFGYTTNSRMYQLEFRYGRLVYMNHLCAVHYVAEVVPLTFVGQPQTNGRKYAYGGGGSPIGAQINFRPNRRVQPFLTSGGGFLAFDRRMFHATKFNFTAQLGAGVQVFTSRRHSIDFGYKYHHISNANRGDTNEGMDSHVLFVGVSLFR